MNAITICVVDDDADVRETLCDVLQESGYKTIGFPDGPRALQRLEKEPVDIVITDLMMPEMDGLELLESIKEIDPELPVIIITGYATVERTIEALRRGANNFITKPFKAEDIIEIVRRTINTRMLLFKDRDKLREIESKLEFEIPSRSDYISSAIYNILSVARTFGFTEKQLNTSRVGLAIHEALLNAITHGNKGDPEKKVKIRCLADSDKITIAIEDEGDGFDVTSTPNPLSPENFYKPSGRGLMFIKYYMDEVKFNERGNEIRMVKNRHRGKDVSQGKLEE
ncbi:MAG: response regulator [bacterium]